MSVIRVASTVAGAAQFSISAAIFDFTDTYDSIPAGSNVVIYGFAYNAPSSAAHTATLSLAASSAADADEWIVLQKLTTATDPPYFTQGCGEKGLFIVPKVSGSTMVIMFVTVGKTADGTLQLWYDVEPVG